MGLQINKNSPIPLYYQLEEGIKELINEGKLQPGDIIPSEREYAEKYEISRMTVRQAINNLVNEGYLVRQKGKGTFVARKKLEQALTGLTGFSEDMKSRGIVPSTKLIDLQVLQGRDSMNNLLGIPKEASIYEIKRIRLGDNIPMAYEVSYIPAELVGDLTPEIVSASLYEYVEQTLQLKIGYARQTLEASIARKLECDILEIDPGTPVLLFERKTYLEDGRPLEVVKSVYPANRYTFIIEMKR